MFWNRKLLGHNSCVMMILSLVFVVLGSWKKRFSLFTRHGMYFW